MTSRNMVLDVARGLAIITVPIQHVMVKMVPDFQSNLFYNFVTSWSMPLFFVVSGYLAYFSLSKSEGNLVKWVKRKALYLLPIHFAFNLVLWFWAKTNLSEWTSLTHVGFAEWVRQTVLFDSGEWFLWTLFFVLCFLALFHKHKIVSYVIGAVLLTAPLFMVYAVNDWGRLLFVAYYIPFALVGYLFAKMNPLLSVKRVAIITAISFVLYLFAGYSLKWQASWGESSLNYLYGFSLIPLVICVSWMVCRMRLVSKITSYIGVSSYGIFVYSQFFTNIGIGNGIVRVISAMLLSLLVGIALTFLTKVIMKSVKVQIEFQK